MRDLEVDLSPEPRSSSDRWRLSASDAANRSATRGQWEHNIYAARLRARRAPAELPVYGGKVWLQRERVSCSDPL